MNRPVAAIDLAKDSLLAVSTLAAPDVAIPRGVVYESYGAAMETPLRAATTVVMEAAPASLRQVAIDRSFYATHGKRFFDLMAGIPLLIIATPIILLAVIAVVLTSGWPAFYASTRVGKDGRSFRMWKIRTMIRRADEALLQWQESHPELAREYLLQFKVRHDPRITSIGHLLRRTSIDELPQFWNVIRGDMSIVGPRPYLPTELSRFPETEAVVALVRPGLTGPWQVSGRSLLAPPERMDLDCHYVPSLSFAKDVFYFLSTFRAVLRSRGI